MALTQAEILRIKQQAKAKGFTEQQVNTALIEVTKQFGGVNEASPINSQLGGQPAQISGGGVSSSTQATPASSSQPGAQQKTEPAQEGSFVGNFFKSIYNTGANYAKFVGEAAAQGVRTVIDPSISTVGNLAPQIEELGKKSRALIDQAKKTTNKAEKRRLLQESRDVDAQIEQLGDRARQVGEKKASFLVDEEKIADRGQIVKTGAKATAGAASLAIPGGATAKTALALGAASGALFGFSEGEEIDPEKIIFGALGGGVGGAATFAAGKLLSKGASAVSKKAGSLFGRSKKAISESLEATAEKSISKASPSVWRKGLEEKGLDLNALTKKYFKKAGASAKKGIGYDELLGTVTERGRGGLLKAEIEANEKAISKVLSASSKNTKISIDDFIKNLNKEIKTLKLIPGNENNIKALNEFVKSTVKQYKNGITPKTMLALKRAADSKFGKAVADEATGSATAQAQKMFANSARKTLKKLFPTIKGALDNESEIYTLRPVLNHARAILKTQGSNIRVGSLKGKSFTELLNPLTHLESALANPKVASRLLGGEVEQQAARTFLQNIPETGAAQLAGRTVGAVVGAGQEEISPGGTEQTLEDLGQKLDDDARPKLDSTSGVQKAQELKKRQPFGGRSKNELMQMAIAEGATLKDLKEIGGIYDMIVPEAGDTEDLLEKRKKLSEAGFNTTDIDLQLAEAGITKKAEEKLGIVDQINEITTAGERNKARATKDILDVVDSAIITAESGVRTGPLSAIGALISKQYAPNETARLEKDLNEILRVVRKESTGVAFSPEELTALKKEVPTIIQQEGNVKDSLARLRIRMLQKLSNYGLDVSGEYQE